MKSITIKYNHEFISNKIRDELLLYDILDFKKVEKEIISEIEELFSFNPGKKRDINTLSGGQRSITYLITLRHILSQKNIKKVKIKLVNILESLSDRSNRIIKDYFSKHNYTLERIRCI